MLCSAKRHKMGGKWFEKGEVPQSAAGEGRRWLGWRPGHWFRNDRHDYNHQAAPLICTRRHLWAGPRRHQPHRPAPFTSALDDSNSKTPPVRQAGLQLEREGCSAGFYFILMIAMFSTRLHINILHCHKNSLIVYKCFIGCPTSEWGQW